MARYSKKTQKTVKAELTLFKHGQLFSGKSHKKVTSRKQALAIALSEARKKGYKAPKIRTKSTAKKRRTTRKR